MQKTFDERLKEAEIKCGYIDNNQSLVTSTSADAIRTYKDLCMQFTLTIDQRHRAILSFFDHDPFDANDMLARWRDSLNYLPVQNREELVFNLLKLIECPTIGSHNRIYTCVTLFNYGRYDICYESMQKLLLDPSLLVEQQIEACRYLYFSEIEVHVNFCKDFLCKLIDNASFTSEFRYRVIAGFSKGTGISTTLNSTRLNIPYNEGFVYPLQHIFFFNRTNGVLERIMSSSALLSMSISDEEKTEVTTLLIEISINTTLGENIRADALDIVIMKGVPNALRYQARLQLTELGFARREGYDRRTVYTDRQNVHTTEIQSSIAKNIEKLISETKTHIPKDFAQIHVEILRLVDRMKLDEKQRKLVFRSLNRINVDTTEFTKLNLTLAEVTVHIWDHIHVKHIDKKDLLEERFIQELLDMADTCASGHIARLVNVLSVVDNDLSISWIDQIISNINGRMNARIRSEKDEELKGSLMTGMLENADKKDKDIFIDWCKRERESLYDEMKDEFVKEGYIKEDEFNKMFLDGMYSYIYPKS